ncbi:unnamed protein product [Oikopleura dioica]|uniref:CUE domain-containing protein n=1 Tax=Oikopleura dioica TaxID=34765 RepID=E4WTR7_OIKDI|nr:unnamed protein product [Oikopleura dioica]
MFEWLEKDITRNKLIELPNTSTWKNIKSFWAIDNQIVTVPIEFCHGKIDTLNLSKNKIKDLPDELGNLFLISFWISDNELVEFPKCITKMRRLGTLDLSNNMLKEVSADLTYCRFLASLELSKNLISEIPQTWGKFKHLRRFAVDGNFIRTLPWEILLASKFDNFAGGRSDDGVFLAENPWEDPEIESAIMEDNFLKLKEIIEQMDFTDSDDENVVPQSRERQGSSSEPAGQSESMGTLHDNPTVILIKEDSEKFRAAVEQFSSMFPHIALELIKNTLKKNDGNSEQTLNELLTV